ncbi:RBBP9/YdeN family alpha/beta hydrolase [Chitinimonas sp.]|uniref:RBBP9/YdeN family alpha/beta hydrolase n=1 Tax=Chitinimonas sp. TaxID=1934313 RepID=UPI002F9357F0
MEMILLPGIGNSGETHWQTHWERADERMRRFAPTNWDAPDLADWIAALERAVAVASTPPFLIAHSLSCLLVAHWARQSRLPVAGALLVAVPDPTSASFPQAAAEFTLLDTARLPFPTLLLASSNDPYAATSHAQHCARQWGSGLVELGELGHINGASGLGDWPQGRALLTAFTAGLAVGGTDSGADGSM